MENNLDPLRMLTLAEAAELMHVSKRTLKRMIEHTEFPAFKVGGQWRVRGLSLTIRVPSLDEQADVILRVQSAFDHTNRIAYQAARAITLLDRLEQAILDKAFRGELPPREDAEQPRCEEVAAG